MTGSIIACTARGMNPFRIRVGYPRSEGANCGSRARFTSNPQDARATRKTSAWTCGWPMDPRCTGPAAVATSPTRGSRSGRRPGRTSIDVRPGAVMEPSATTTCRSPSPSGSTRSTKTMRPVTDRQPATSWTQAAPDEYGFYANVNPAVDHPRWSQARERRVGEWRRRVTLPFNGYADQVQGLYAGMDLVRNF